MSATSGVNVRFLFFLVPIRKPRNDIDSWLLFPPKSEHVPYIYIIYISTFKIERIFEIWLTEFFLQVLRYSALAFGVFYGFTHQRSISATQRAAAAQKEYEHKQHLIEQARAEYNKSKNPAPASTQKSGRTSSDSRIKSQRSTTLGSSECKCSHADISNSEPRPDGPEIRPGSILQCPDGAEAVNGALWIGT